MGDATKKAVESGLRDLSLGAMGYHCASPNQLRPSVECWIFLHPHHRRGGCCCRFCCIDRRTLLSDDSDELIGEAKLKAQWNVEILECLLPVLYAEFLSRESERITTNSSMRQVDHGDDDDDTREAHSRTLPPSSSSS